MNDTPSDKAQHIISECISGVENFFCAEFPKRDGFIHSYGAQIDALAGAPEPDDSHVHQIAAVFAVKLGSSPTQEQIFGVLKEAVRKGWRYGNRTIKPKFVTLVASSEVQTP